MTNGIFSVDERLDGIMRELSLDQKYLLHVTDKALGERLQSALTDARSNQDAIHRRIQSQLAEYRDRLADMGAFLKQYNSTYKMGCAQQKVGPTMTDITSEQNVRK